MIHVLTVHYETDFWIDVQKKYLDRHLESYKLYGFLNGIDSFHHSKFDYTATEPVEASSSKLEHAIKLNLLADIATESGSPDDLLIFIDGDAFPIGDVETYVREKLQEYPLVAIQRRENYGDIQPHPSFCATTIKFWNRIQGDWKPGYQWENNSGLVTDVGGNLLGILEENDIDWYPMLRSNETDLHPLWFGIYDEVVYHHGAGFREMKSRVDKSLAAINSSLRQKVGYWTYCLANMLPKYAPGMIELPLIRELQTRLSEKFGLQRQIRKNEEMSKEILNTIHREEDFYRKLA